MKSSGNQIEVAPTVKFIKNKTTYLSKSKIKERGWTDTLIRKFLPVHDTERPNPHYRKAPPMLLYLEERVLEAEQSPAFKESVDKGLKRKLGAKKAVDAKKSHLLEEIENLTIEVPYLDKATLLKKACEHYYTIWSHLGSKEKYASLNAGEAFLHRIVVNYLRHAVSSYEQALAQTAGRVGRKDAGFLIRKKVYGAIAEKYPWLKLECDSQLKTRSYGLNES